MQKAERKEMVISEDSRALTDFFKGIAILLVILVHIHQKLHLPPLLHAVQSFCQMGCQIFFVLSAFGLCHSFSARQAKWLTHMKKRIYKLLPGYWGAIVIHAFYRVFLARMSGEDIVLSLNIPGILINMLFLNGLVPINRINNTIVRGGWYVGTTVILYALFPYLYKMYFSGKNKRWKKYRPVLFPTCVFGITSVTVMALGSVHPDLTCHNNSFVYFSFINQLTPFSLGIVLFDMVTRCCIVKKAWIVSLSSLVTTIIMFFGEYQYSFICCPSLAAVSFLFAYLAVSNSQNKIPLNPITNSVIAFGKNSFPIYLTHAFIVYDFLDICMQYLRPVYNYDLLWYILLFPLCVWLSYMVGSLYSKCISFTKTVLAKAVE